MEDTEKINEICERLKQLAYASLGVVVCDGKREDVMRYITENDELSKELAEIHARLLKMPLSD